MSKLRWLRVRRARPGALLVGVATVALLNGCDGDPTGPGSSGSPTVSLSVGIAGAGASPTALPFAQGLTLRDGMGNELVAESVDIVVREIKFERLETPGCDSTLGDDDCEEFEVGPFLVDLPLDGSVTRMIEAPVEPGIYDEIEFKLHKPDDDTPADLEFINRNPAFADISVRVSGTYNGEAFTFTSDLNAVQELQLGSPLQVTQGSGPINVTLTVDFSNWFQTPARVLLDPRTALKGELNEDLVEANIEASFEGFRDDDRDGVPHDADDDES